MENEEIVRLRKLKEQLLNKVLQLRDSLKKQEENGRQSSFNFNVTLPADVDVEEQKPSESLLSAKHEAKLCEITGQVTGITFEDVSKKWLRDDVYFYTAKVVTKMVSFDLELTVILHNSDDFTVDDIMCHFVAVEDCYMLEIAPWFQGITRTKNFSLLMSALSDYNEYAVLRFKILRSLESNGYAKVENCTEENGGALVYVRSRADTGKSYLTFRWTLKFLDRTWHIEHFFTVKPTDIGIGFAEENSALLQEFCKIGLTKNNLMELWDALCGAIDTYHAKSAEKTRSE